MDQESITKGILSGIVDHYIQEIARDPNRSIRKLLDMAECTSDGPTQKICYQMMQQMAADQSSPYYDMIHFLVTHTNPQTIKQFGINLGHNAWTFGSGKMRRAVEQNNETVSWAVMIDRTACPERFDFNEIKALVERGRKLDVYAWLLMTDGMPDEWDEYAEMFRTYSDSVFGLLVFPEALTDEIIEEAADIPNLMIILKTDSPDWQVCADHLLERGLLFSACKTISGDEDAAEVLSGSWMEELLPHHPLIAFTLADDALSEETAAKIKEYMWNVRLDQQYPILPSDLISDFVIINQLVAHRDIIYRVDPDGSVSESRKYVFGKGPLHCGDIFCL